MASGRRAVTLTGAEHVASSSAPAEQRVLATHCARDDFGVSVLLVPPEHAVNKVSDEQRNTDCVLRLSAYSLCLATYHQRFSIFKLINLLKLD